MFKQRRLSGASRSCVHLGLMILSLLSMESALAQSGAERDPRLGRLCGTPNQQPCLPDLIDASIQKSPTVFNLQVRVSPAKIPSGRGVVLMFVNLSNREGDVLCSETFSNPVKIRNGVLNLEIGRGMNCALDEVLMENEVIRIQLCIGSEESCLRPIELTAVPFALSAHYATEAKKARTATVAARTDVTHRATADTDILKPSAVGYGYFDFFSPSDEQLAPLGLGSSLDGSLLWTPVRGHEDGEEFPANQILFVGEDTQGEIAMLRAIHLLAVDTTIRGRARVLNGHVDIQGSGDVTGAGAVHRRISAPKMTVASGGAVIKGDSLITEKLSAGDVRIEQGADLRARVRSGEQVFVRDRMVATQKHVRLGQVSVSGGVTLSSMLQTQIGGPLTVEGELIEDPAEPTVPPMRRGLSVQGGTQVDGDVRISEETVVSRRFVEDAPQASIGQGVFMKTSSGSQRRLLSVRESGVVELNRPAESTGTPIEQVRLKARRVVFEGETSFQDGRLGNECELRPVENKLLLICNDQVFSFAADQCGNGRRFRCSCGDGNQDPSEECDDGDQDDLDGCLRSCTLARCGDLLVRSDLSDPTEAGYEECDDGNLDETDACHNNCLRATCGDGIVRQDISLGEEGYEECDDGNLDDSDGCTSDCTIAVCGDGRLSVARGEECDDGNLIDGDGCDSLCRREICGNGILQAGEECDDQNSDASDGCVNCRVARCGDGFVRAGFEECDDGNQSHADGCISCRIARCGDGYLLSGVEECDDGNTNEYDQCRANCTNHCDSIDKVGHFVDQSGSITVDTRGRRSSLTSAGGNGPQVAVALTLSQTRRVTFEVTSQDYDAYYHLRSACDDRAHIAYDDDSGGYLKPKIDRTLDAGTYYLIVDGYARRSGTSTTQITVHTCEEIPVVSTLTNATGSFTLNTSGGARLNTRLCGGNGPQKAIRFTLGRTSTVRFTTSNARDPVLHLRRDLNCSVPRDIVCDDDSGPGLNAEIRTTLGAGTYYLVVDGYGGTSGAVTVNYEFR